MQRQLMTPFFLSVLRIYEIVGLKAMNSMPAHFVDGDYDRKC